MFRTFLLVLLLVCAVAASAARAESDLLTSEDLHRLAQFEQVREEAIAAARKNGPASDVAVLEGILGGEELPVRGLDIRGDYRCRVAKLGAASEGLLDLIIYDWFRCRISEDDIGYYLEKTSGSQRLSGHFIDDSETGLIFYGASHYHYEEPRPYGADPERNVVARFVRVGEDRYRLEQPLPAFESKFDILELERRS